MSISERYPAATANELLNALRARAVSAEELLDIAIARIEALDGPMNAVVVRDYENARIAARAADARLATGEGGPLCGLPMTVKESFDLAGHPTTWGVAAHADYRAPVDALAVQRLKTAGAVVLGKTNVSVMLADWNADNPVYGRTGNPYDLSRSPGGSSGGSAAALASGFVPLELGSDIGGSIRIPAAFCGVFGHKPSYGLVPTLGHGPGGADVAPPPLGVAGPLARSADDLRLALEVVAGPWPAEERAWRLSLPPARHKRLPDFRVLILDAHPHAAVDGEIVAAIHALADRLERKGARVSREPESIPELAFVDQTYRRLLFTITSRRANSGRTPPSAHDWLDLLDAQLRIRKGFAEVFAAWDVIIAPVLGVTAFPHIEEPDWARRRLPINGEAAPYDKQLAWVGIANVANLPATAFPIGMSRDGLPIGVQAIGPYLEDITPIAFAGLAASEIPAPNPSA